MRYIQKITLYLAYFLLIKSTCIAQFEEFCLKYDILSTIAGKGQIQEKGVNGWIAGYEGGSALAAELSRPHFAMADKAGNVFIADKERRITVTTKYCKYSNYRVKVSL